MPKIEEIPFIPNLPEKIKDAILSEKIVVFLGAGVSRSCGCHGWKEMAENLLNLCYKTKNSEGNPLLHIMEKNTFLKDKDYKKIISICKELLNEKSFFDEIKKGLQSKDEEKGIYNELHDLIYDRTYSIDSFFITTNIDNVFIEKKFSDSDDFVIKNPVNIEYDPKKFALYHLHGHIDDKKSVVLTIDEYFKRYNENSVKNFLNATFSQSTVLFIGYGLAEFEIIDFLFTKFVQTENNELKHFILRPYWSYENKLVIHEQKYYNHLGIKIIPYAKDNGYGEFTIIQKWNEELSKDKKKLNELKNNNDFLNNFDKFANENDF